MPKRAKKLSAVEVKRINKPGRHAVGTVSGLLLFVKDSGTKSWILRTMMGSKRRNMGLGAYPEVTLAMAHEKSRKYKEIIEQGIDPIADRQSKKNALKKASMSGLTFKDAADRCHQKKSQEFKNVKHVRDWINSLTRYAFPTIGNMPVSEIDLPHILTILEPIWFSKTDTANRVRLRIEQVLTWAKVGGYREGKNPARWKDHLSEILPKPSKIIKRVHLPALSFGDIGAFMVELRKRPAMTARALEWIIYTVCRSGEVRGATWDEVDLKNKIWIIPAERMKMNQEHKVPLCRDAIKLLKSLPRFEGSNYIFPAPRGGQLSDMSISMLCRRMKVEAVPHGFRSTFKDWCAETTSFPDMVSEMALAHSVGSEVEKAYRRGDLFEKRRRLMDAWMEYCNIVQTEARDNVTSIRGGV